MNHEAYHAISAFYDRVNADIDYDAWADYIEDNFRRHLEKRPELLLDLACGTGVLTIRFAKKGYDMIAVDLSEDMLMTARENADDAEVSPLFLCQDMRSLDLYGTVEGGYCCLNSLNYLEEESELDTVFSHLKHFVAPGGVFVFYVNTAYNFHHTYGENTYIYDEEGVYCIWQNSTEESPLAANFDLTFFKKGRDGRYTRLEESQRQIYLSPEAIERAYTENGFETVACYGSTSFDTPKDDDEALWFVIRRKA